MKTETKEIHSCDFCKKKLFIKGAMVRHEDNCKKNPKNWAACHECKFKELISKTFESSDYFGSNFFATGFKCSKLNKEMHPHKAVRKGLVKKYPETFVNSILMPKECEFFKREELSF